MNDQGLDDFQLKWLRACAVYPVLRWPLTVYLGRNLSTENTSYPKDYEPDLSAHVPLSRLGWFRQGFIPPEDRRQLIASMSEDERTEAFDLYRRLLLRVSAEVDTKRDKPAEDPLFAQFMLQEQPGPRERAVNRVLTRHYGQEVLARWDARTWLGIAGGLVSAVVLGLLMLGITQNWTTPGAVTKTIPIPQMVNLPGGVFNMGSPPDEPGREDNEGPVRQVTIQPFAIARTEVTVRQYGAFVQDSDYETSGGCVTWNDEEREWGEESNANWANPGFPQTGDHPVTCINWNDAQAYIDWLNTKIEGGGYRLPSEAEWEYAARGGQAASYYWSGVTHFPDRQCAYANGVDVAASRHQVFPEAGELANCDDGYVFAAPAPTADAVDPKRLPNGFALADMSGNLLEFVEDCWHDDYEEAPTDGSVWLSSQNGDCSGRRVARGGSWLDGPQFLRSAARIWLVPGERLDVVGFRPARTL